MDETASDYRLHDDNAVLQSAFQGRRSPFKGRQEERRHQGTDLGDAYRQPSVDGYAERIDAEMELLGACDNGKNHTHVLCGLPQPV